MPRLVNQNPSYRLHKASGRAAVTLDGHTIYLGKYGTKESREAYDREIAEWLANGRRRPASAAADLTVTELIRDFLRHAKEYYRRADGTPTSEMSNFIDALRPLKQLYGNSLARDFGPLALKAVRDDMIGRAWCRTHINRQLKRVRHVFKWAVGNEMVPGSVHEALRAVDGIKSGRSKARESEPVKPVPDERVDAVLPLVSRPVAGMIKLQRLTGMRPGEACAMRGCDLDTTGRLWLYTPGSHKNTHRGHVRTIYLGPQAQEILKPFLRPNMQECLFQPVDAEADRRAKMHAARKTPTNQGNTPGSNKRRNPLRAPTSQYKVTSYCRAIKDACERAFSMPAELKAERRDSATEAKMTSDERAKLEQQRKARSVARKVWRKENCWHPHQLRHSAGTRLRKQFGLELSRIVLGHRSMAVTEIYAEQDLDAVRETVMAIG